MAKFYLIENGDGDNLGCQSSLHDAIAALEGGPGTVTRVTCKIDRETMVKILSGWGGYASEVVQVYRKDQTGGVELSD